MKLNQNNQRKFNLNKQTVQRLDNGKLSNIKAGNADAEAGTTWLASAFATLTVTYTGSVTATVMVACTIADAN